MVERLRHGGPLDGLRVPGNLGVRAARSGMFVSQALRVLYRHLTHYVHPKPETLDFLHVPVAGCYQCNLFSRLTRILVDIIALASLFLEMYPKRG